MAALKSSLSSPAPYSAIILDLGDVLFSWSAETKTSISPKTLKRILESPTWYEFEKGLVSQDDCYARVSQEFDIPASEIAKAFQDARDSLTPNNQLITLIKELKARSLLTVIAMSNISQPDYEYLRTKPGDWSIFDHVFTSAAAGERKPNIGFYQHVVSSTGIGVLSRISCLYGKTILILYRGLQILARRCLSMTS
jgi:FMN phosphatase YigB (HAD superfamily)